MFTFVLFCFVVGVFGGVFYLLTQAGGTSSPTQDSDDENLPFYGTKGSSTQVVILPNGELGYRTGLDLDGNHF